MGGPPDLSLFQVASAVALVIVNAIISISLKLGMQRSLLIASCRTVVQLTMIGVVLDTVFSSERVEFVILLLLVMTIIAGWTASNRIDRKYSGSLLDALLATWVSSWGVGTFAILAVIQPSSYWLDPHVVIPLLGMILGNSLTGVSLGINAFTDGVASDRQQIESLLSLGATRWEAAQSQVVRAVRTGMIPMINSMTVVGIVSLPGMMTGQLLAGADPTTAVKYQIVIMFVIASATAIGTVAVVLLAFRRLLTSDHTLVLPDEEGAP